METSLQKADEAEVTHKTPTCKDETTAAFNHSEPYKPANIEEHVLSDVLSDSTESRTTPDNSPNPGKSKVTPCPPKLNATKSATPVPAATFSSKRTNKDMSNYDLQTVKPPKKQRESARLGTLPVTKR